VLEREFRSSKIEAWVQGFHEFYQEALQPRFGSTRDIIPLVLSQAAFESPGTNGF
jgi:hypothetical protein